MANILEKLEMLFSETWGLQKRVEQEAGLSGSRFTKWKASKTKKQPDVSQANRIAHALGVPVAWLCDDSLGGRPEDYAGVYLTGEERKILELTRGLSAEDVRKALVVAMRAGLAAPDPARPGVYPKGAGPPRTGFRSRGKEVPTPPPAAEPRRPGGGKKRPPTTNSSS